VKIFWGEFSILDCVKMIMKLVSIHDHV
jgi:hypothetical protein